MRTIQKGHEPESLRRHRRSGGIYEDFKETDDVRRALLSEQGDLCAFCMRRISLRSMKIAHWAAQSEHQDKTVSWDNLLGACTGGEGLPRAHQTCDTAQGNTPITVHPGDRDQRCERSIRYLPDGQILSDDPQIHGDIDRTLNLNQSTLKKARKAVLDSALSQLTKAQPGYWSRADLIAWIAWWKQRDGGKLRELCQVAIYVLEKQLAKRND